MPALWFVQLRPRFPARLHSPPKFKSPRDQDGIHSADVPEMGGSLEVKRGLTDGPLFIRPGTIIGIFALLSPSSSKLRFCSSGALPTCDRRG